VRLYDRAFRPAHGRDFTQSYRSSLSPDALCLVRAMMDCRVRLRGVKDGRHQLARHPPGLPDTVLQRAESGFGFRIGLHGSGLHVDPRQLPIAHFERAQTCV